MQPGAGWEFRPNPIQAVARAAQVQPLVRPGHRFGWATARRYARSHYSSTSESAARPKRSVTAFSGGAAEAWTHLQLDGGGGGVRQDDRMATGDQPGSDVRRADGTPQVTEGCRGQCMWTVVRWERRTLPADDPIM